MASIKELTRAAHDALLQHYPHNALLLIHPSSRHRTLLIASLLDEAPCPIFYYGLGLEDISLDGFLTGLARDLAAQSPTFGRYIGATRSESSDNIPALAQALAQDLNDLNAEDFILVLDEYDRADPVAEVQMFMEELLNYLPRQCHILISSRSLPRLPWVALVARGQAVVLRDDRMLTTGFYAGVTTPNPNIEVFALGPGYVIVDGQQVTTWEGHLPRLLFFFVLDRPLVTRAEICQAFWPELPIDQAVNVFHVTKRRLHKALGFDVLLHESGRYRIDPAFDLQYDVLEYVGTLVEARSLSGAEAAVFWQRAIDAYRGEFLQGHLDEWVIQRRADFRAGHVQALSELGRIRAGEGQHEEALGLYLRAVRETPNREDLHREAMRQYAQLGRRAEAAEHYNTLRNMLHSQFGVEPAPETQALFQQVTSA